MPPYETEGPGALPIQDVSKEELFGASSVVDSYPINSHSTAFIIRNQDYGGLLYYVDEPDLTPLEEAVRFKVTSDLKELLQDEPIESMSPDERAETVRRIGRKRVDVHQPIFARRSNRLFSRVERLIDDYDFLRKRLGQYKLPRFRTLNEVGIEKVLYYLERDFARLGKITPLMQDELVEDISANAPQRPVFVYHQQYEDLVTNRAYRDNEIDTFVSSLAQMSGKQASVSHPNLQGRLPDGSRLQLSYGKEVSPDGSNFTIRKFKEVPFTPPDLINSGTFSIDQMTYLWLMVEFGMSTIFFGSTASGKTTAMNAVSMFIPPTSKVVTIEDTRELVIRQENWVKSVTRESHGASSKTDIDMYDLLRAGLRQRPEYVLVGEIRGEEARTLFQTMSTGHSTYSTMHAKDFDSVVKRLSNDPINLPLDMIEELDVAALLKQRKQEKGSTQRRCTSLVEVTGVDENDENLVNTIKVFDYDFAADRIERKRDSRIVRMLRKEVMGRTEQEMEEELENRRRVLRHLCEKRNLYTYEQISETFRRYSNDPEAVLETLEETGKTV